METDTYRDCKPPLRWIDFYQCGGWSRMEWVDHPATERYDKEVLKFLGYSPGMCFGNSSLEVWPHTKNGLMYCEIHIGEAIFPFFIKGGVPALFQFLNAEAKTFIQDGQMFSIWDVLDDLNDNVRGIMETLEKAVDAFEESVDRAIDDLKSTDVEDEDPNCQVLAEFRSLVSSPCVNCSVRGHTIATHNSRGGDAS